MRARRRLLKLTLLTAASCAALTAAACALRWRVASSYGGRVYASAAEVPAAGGGGAAPVAVVLGAGVRNGTEPSAVLYDRVAAAAELYRAGRVRALLMSGDNRFRGYNEPAVMRDVALRLGVPAGAVVQDFAGRRTYDTCYRAREIFGVRRAVVVTQRFHAARALYLCQSLGVESVALAADRREYPAWKHLWWSLREVPATAAAWADLNLLRPSPVLGDRMPIEVPPQSSP